jgi:hypothetical protein
VKSAKPSMGALAYGEGRHAGKPSPQWRRICTI